jgi:hypothetical protein
LFGVIEGLVGMIHAILGAGGAGWTGDAEACGDLHGLAAHASTLLPTSRAREASLAWLDSVSVAEVTCVMTSIPPSATGTAASNMSRTSRRASFVAKKFKIISHRSPTRFLPSRIDPRTARLD